MISAMAKPLSKEELAQLTALLVRYQDAETSDLLAKAIDAYRASEDKGTAASVRRGGATYTTDGAKCPKCGHIWHAVENGDEARPNLDGDAGSYHLHYYRETCPGCAAKVTITTIIVYECKS